MLNPAVEMTSDEIVKASWLRSVEWSQWPVFLFQPLLPIFLLWLPPLKLAVYLLVLGYVWILFRNRFVSFLLATLGCFWVRLKWVTIPVMCLYFGLHHQWKAFVVSLLSPLVIMFISGVVLPTNILPLQRRMWKQIGFDPEQVERNRMMDEMKLMTRSL